LLAPKESNQRKRQPQIFFGFVIFSSFHALQLARLLALAQSLAQAVTLEEPFPPGLKNANLIPKKI
jgi:hypothetical protein